MIDVFICNRLINNYLSTCWNHIIVLYLSVGNIWYEVVSLQLGDILGFREAILKLQIFTCGHVFEASYIT